ncbi:MFS transporter [Neobacillus sp. PS3-34]|uniref:MFS transporter n=1 Tax=Neobacillus sp. PS3-34 TaxID=3070678 RepID=UPI0027E123CE|nr:MFS transporter [Neobacillus sp. PS3-34]WML49237.1 MFS transporter [Neobacillus sp. PS3-34]
MNRKIYLYVKAFSDLGSFMDMIALNIVIYTATGSSGWLAASLALRTFGGVLSSLLSGVLADRFDRRKIMIFTDWFRALMILSIIPFPDPAMIMVVSFLIGLTGSIFGVSFSSEVPQIFGEDKVIETNALIARLTSISMVAGFIGSGIITNYFGYKTTLMIDAGTYLLSAIVLMRMRWDSASNFKKPFTSGVKDKLISVGLDIKEVFSYITLAPLLLMVNILSLVGAFAGSSHNLGIPILAEQMDSERQSFYYGMIWGIWGIGSVLATLILPKLKWLLGNRVYYACFASAIMMSTGFIIFLSNINPWIVFSFAFFTGIFDAFFTTLYSTILQKTENHIRGRIFGVAMLLKSLGFALGFVVAPILLKHLDLPRMVWTLHGLFITTSLIIIFLANGYRLKNQNVNHIKEQA